MSRSSPSNCSPRVVPVSDLLPCENHITCLPFGQVLIDATPDELKIIELYAREIDRIKPLLVAWVTEANDKAPAVPELYRSPLEDRE